MLFSYYDFEFESATYCKLFIGVAPYNKIENRVWILVTFTYPIFHTAEMSQHKNWVDT